MTRADNGTAHISIVKSSDTRSAVKRALDLVGGLEKAVAHHSSIVVKPNFCGGVPGERGSHTSIPVLEALLELLAPLKKKVYIGEADGSFNRADQVFSTLGVHDVAKRYGAQVINLSTGPSVELTVPQSLSLKTLRVSRLLTESAIISVAVLKTHPWTGVTFTMKNMFGAIYEPEKALLHAGLDKNIVDITKVLRPALSLVDGIYAVKHGGFKYGVWVGYPPDKMDLVVAGHDPVATDVVCTTLLEKDPRHAGFIEMAGAQDVGVNNPQQIKVATENYSYQPGVEPHSRG
jgi:uncharacterized protein (DUF362 family)